MKTVPRNARRFHFQLETVWGIKEDDSSGREFQKNLASRLLEVRPELVIGERYDKNLIGGDPPGTSSP